jgi:hypothetical protein
MNKQLSKKLKSTGKNNTFVTNLGYVNRSIIEIYLGNQFQRTVFRKANKNFRITHNSTDKPNHASPPTQKYLDILLPKVKNPPAKAAGFQYDRPDRRASKFKII